MNGAGCGSGSWEIQEGFVIPKTPPLHPAIQTASFLDLGGILPPSLFNFFLPTRPLRKAQLC